jgi:hypothetical protein
MILDRQWTEKHLGEGSWDLIESPTRHLSQ